MNDSRSLEIDRLVDTYADTILRLCHTYLHSTADAEDLCQNVLLKLMERKKPFVNEEHEKASFSLYRRWQLLYDYCCFWKKNHI